jgi:hypothetical protein
MLKLEMMKIYFTILLLGFCTVILAQDKPVIENGEPFNVESVPPFLASLQKDNDYVLTFRTTSPRNPEPDYFVLTRKGTKLSSYLFDQNSQKLTNLPIKTDSLKNLLWKAYTEFDIFKIKDQKELSVFCPEKYEIFDSYTYEIILVSKERMKLLSFYDPEYYDRVCPGMDERQKVINCASLISYVLSR